MHPEAWTKQNIAFMRDEQLKKLGTSFDWDREVTTCDSDYYHWTQWLFLQFYEARFGRAKEAPVNWCPECQTVLANEQVEDGACWRHPETRVEQKLDEVSGFCKITDYAEPLFGSEQAHRLAGPACASCSKTGSASRKARDLTLLSRATECSNHRFHDPP